MCSARNVFLCKTAPVYKTDTIMFPGLIVHVWSDYLSSWYLIVNLLQRFYSWPVHMWQLHHVLDFLDFLRAYSLPEQD